MAQYVYAITDGDELSVIDYRVHVFWHKFSAEDFIKKRELKGHKVKRVRIEVSRNAATDVNDGGA